jgi:histidine phosphotransferase ChpT
MLDGLPQPLTRPTAPLPASSELLAIADAAGAPAVDAVRLTQLLCSRLCHDLIGPVGVAASGSDLLELSEASGAEAMALIIDSAKQAARRLAFYRIAFGYGRGAGAGPGFSELKSLADAYFAGSRITPVWIDDRASSQQVQPLAMPVARLLACLLLVAAETLPRGGALSVTLGSDAGGGLTLSVAASGHGARLSGDAADALSGHADDNLNPRTVVPFYVHCLSQALDSPLRIAVEDGRRVAFELAVAAAAGSIALS